jgi:hypothetical protein
MYTFHLLARLERVSFLWLETALHLISFDFLSRGAVFNFNYRKRDSQPLELLRKFLVKKEYLMFGNSSSMVVMPNVVALTFLEDKRVHIRFINIIDGRVHTVVTPFLDHSTPPSLTYIDGRLWLIRVVGVEVERQIVIPISPDYIPTEENQNPRSMLEAFKAIEHYNYSTLGVVIQTTGMCHQVDWLDPEDDDDEYFSDSYVTAEIFHPVHGQVNFSQNVSTVSLPKNYYIKKGPLFSPHGSVWFWMVSARETHSVFNDGMIHPTPILLLGKKSTSERGELLTHHLVLPQTGMGKDPDDDIWKDPTFIIDESRGILIIKDSEDYIHALTYLNF